jgi:hypothetical protein
MRKSRATGLALFGAGALAALGYFGSGLATTPGAASAAGAQPVVVELFQSQGCSSCPPANAYLNTIADRPDILALSFAVTYWDRLGWKDTFGSPRFTARQQDYAAAGRGEVATPELIVNGSNAVVGSDKHAFDAAIATAGAPSGGPGISIAGSSLRLGAAPAASPATVWLVRYDPRVRNVPIRAGENGGRTLPHRGIVRELVDLGAWSGRPASYTLPPAREPGLSAAVLLQRGSGGPIIGARKL